MDDQKLAWAMFSVGVGVNILCAILPANHPIARRSIFYAGLSFMAAGPWIGFALRWFWPILFVSSILLSDFIWHIGRSQMTIIRRKKYDELVSRLLIAEQKAATGLEIHLASDQERITQLTRENAILKEATERLRAASSSCQSEKMAALIHDADELCKELSQFADSAGKEWSQAFLEHGSEGAGNCEYKTAERYSKEFAPCVHALTTRFHVHKVPGGFLRESYDEKEISTESDLSEIVEEIRTMTVKLREMA